MTKVHSKRILAGILFVFSHILAIVLASPLVIDLYLHSETTFKPQPEIDTVFTDSFSKSRFETVTNGMSTDKVRELLGEPFSKQNVKIVLPEPNNSGKIIKTGETIRPQSDAECWYYSKDGDLKGADFSWFSYRVCFEDDIVYLKSIMEHVN